MLFIYYLILHGLFGLIIGSFLNVAILRHSTGRTLLGRSGCAICQVPLPWYTLVPVVSWLIQGRRCHNCGARISLQYPLVEIATAVFFMVIAGAALPVLLHVLALILVALLVAITVYDMRHTIIPDNWVYAFSILAFIFAAAALPALTYAGVGSVLLAGGAAAAPLTFLWLVSRGRWMGLGDGKLMLGFGFLLGLPSALYALMGAFVLGAFVSVCLIIPLQWMQYTLAHRGITALKSQPTRFTMKSEIAFGPFLIASSLCIWILQLYDVPLTFSFLLF